MELLPDEIRDRLFANYHDEAEDHIPVVKFFTPDANCTWLIIEMEPDGDLMFGLCDLGMGFPELGYVSFAELAQLRGKLGLPVERDLYWEGKYPISVYAEKAREKGYIHD